MKKYLLVIAVLGLTLTSCKKDRVCSCKVVTSYSGPWNGLPAAKPADYIIDYEYTIVKVGLIAARRSSCIHTKSSEPYFAGPELTESVDSNCELK